MKLVSFSVENYRSINKAKRVKIEQTTVLVGPNNEGKSNLLKALVVAMDVLTRRQGLLARSRMTRTERMLAMHHFRTDRYTWKDDFPISLQDSKPTGQSVFELEFELGKEEIAEFRREIKSALNGTLPLRICIGPETSSIGVKKKGPGGKALTAKSARIAEFVSQRVQFRYIPAIRTATLVDDVVAPMVERELESVESQPEYKAALTEIAKLQKPVLDQLASSMKSIMSSFLPDLKSVRFEITQESRYQALRRARMILDDGSPTYLDYKGDGVQSLAALALMRYASERGAVGRNLVVALEEPESHLHPDAIHGLKAVLQALAEKHQVVITTHCPVFVERANVGANIIVHRQKARPAKSIQEIREILGVRASDNLRHAEVMLIVEGSDDVKAIKAILCALSPKLKNALLNNTLALDSLGGGSNLAYKLSYLRNALCLIHSFLDNDAGGTASADKARDQGLLCDADVQFATCPDKNESEIEDLYDVELYKSEIHSLYGVSLECPKFHSKKKWSDRVKDTFLHQGKHWDERVEMAVKEKVADLVAANPGKALNAHRRGPIDAVAASLLQKLRIPPEKSGIVSFAVAVATVPAEIHLDARQTANLV